MRRAARRARRALPKAVREEKSAAILARLYREPAYQQAHTLLTYVGVNSEVATLPLIRRALAEGKRVVVPATEVATKRLWPLRLRNPRDLAPGAYGIPEPRPGTSEPVALEELELIVVPGLAFDCWGHRLGQGTGYFDRFLSKVPPHVPRIALAFDVQVVDKVPVEPHDQPVTLILTESKRIEPPPGGG